MKNEKVKHKTLGEGIITEVEPNYIYVHFASRDKTIKFQYPMAFDDFLTFEDEKLQSNAKNVVDEMLEEKRIEEEQARSERAAAAAAKASKYKKGEPIIIRSNVAVKCTFCNGGADDNHIGFAGICSEENIRKNIKDKRPWCNNARCKEFFDGNLTYEELEKEYHEVRICYESDMLKDWVVYSGVHNSGKRKGEPLKFKEGKANGMAFLTTRFPGAKEADRVIFGAFIIEEYFEGDGVEEGYLAADLDYCIEMDPEESKELKFWMYYFNENSPERKQFGSGLHRYMTDHQTVQALQAICEIKKGKKDEDQAKKVLDRYMELNEIEIENVGQPEGPLARG